MEDPTLSPEEQNVQEIVSDASAQIKQKEEAIKNTPSDKGPQPSPPGGNFGGTQPGNKQQKVADHKSGIDAIREGALNNTAAAIKGNPVDAQVKAYKIADNLAYPKTSSQNNPVSKRGEEKDLESAQNSAMQQLGHDVPMQDRAAEKKDISASQDLAMRKLGDEKEKNALNPSPNPDNRFKEASMSQRFDMSLGYSKMNKPIEKGNDKPEPTKMSMSDKFLTSLAHSKASEPTSPTSSKDSKPKGKDKDVT